MADTLNYASSPRPGTPSETQKNPLTAIIRRLEAATSRLEDIASTSTSFESLENGKLAQGNAPRASAPNLPGTAVAGSPAVEAPKPAAPELPPAIQEMDELIEGQVKTFVEASRGIDPLVEGQVCIHVCKGTAGSNADCSIGRNHSEGFPRPKAFHCHLDQGQEARHELCWLP